MAFSVFLACIFGFTPLGVFAQADPSAPATAAQIQQLTELEMRIGALLARRAAEQANVGTARAREALVEQMKGRVQIITSSAQNAGFEDRLRALMARRLATVPDAAQRVQTIRVWYSVKDQAPGLTEYNYLMPGGKLSPNNPDYRMTIEGPDETELLNTASHEVEHVCMVNETGCVIPRWADEGLATLVGERAQDVMKHYRDLASSRVGMFHIERLVSLTEYPRDPTTSQMLYAEGAGLSDFLRERLRTRLGPERQENAYRNMILGFSLSAQTKGLQGAMQEYAAQFGFAGVSTEKIEAEFLDFVKKRVIEAGPPPANSR